MKLEVIFDTARPGSPTISDTLNEGKYLLETRFWTILLNFSFSALSDGKNCVNDQYSPDCVLGGLQQE